MTKAEQTRLTAWRLRVLQQAADDGNVARVCRRFGISRQSYYKWKRRRAEHGHCRVADVVAERSMVRTMTFLFLLLAVCIELLPAADRADAQDLGHKLPGLIGLEAGKVPPPGLYLIDRLVSYEADELRDRRGTLIPVADLQLLGRSNAMGLSYTIQLPRRTTSFTMTVAAPLARLRLNIHDRPEASFDRFGLADIYIQPALLGWRLERVDLVTSYGLYLPTGTSPLAGGKGLSTGQVTHQFSVGGSIYANTDRTSFVTALASYDANLRKRGIDITRGDTLNIQGGAGTNLFDRVVEAGVAFNSLWQVRADRGADLPVVLSGARDRVYGLGPDVAVMIKAIQSQLRIRYEWDMGVRSRPKGNVFVVGLNITLQRPQQPAAPLQGPSLRSASNE